MKKITTVLVFSILVLLLFGCRQDFYPEMGTDAIAFELGTYKDEEDNDNDSYAIIEYNGREYMPYGTLGDTFRKNNIDKCIGYIIEEEDSSSDDTRRIYTLAEDADKNFLVDHIDDAIMEQPLFWRAMDTKGKEITIPKYIDSLGYLYWK